MSGLFISFEGSDGSGKSTHIRLLAETLRSLGHEVVVTREPGGCPIAEKIRELLLDRENEAMTPVTEALLYAAARAQHVAEVIRPALEAGTIVITDRYLDSSLAYQGVGRGLGQEAVLRINEAAVDGLWPDITFFMSVNTPEAVRRISRREPDRLEMAGTPLQSAVQQAFCQLAVQYPERIVTIDTTLPKPDVHRAVADVVLPRLQNHNR